MLMKRVQLTNFTLFIFALLFNSCIDENKDLYDPSYQTANPINITAPIGFTGQMISSAKIKVDVNDEYNGAYDYVITLYDRDPAAEDANQLSVGVAKKEQPFETTINRLEGVNTIYVEQTDPRGRKQFTMLELSNDTEAVNYVTFNSIANQPKTRGSITRAIAERPEYTVYTINDVPANAIEITNGTIIQSNKTYKITKSFNGTFTNYGVQNSKLFIIGTWTLQQFQVENGLEIIVLPGANIKADDLHLVNNSSLEVMQGGTAEIGTLELSNSNKIINLGKMILKRTTNNPGTFYNGVNDKDKNKENGVITVSEDFYIGGSLFYNDGRITAKNLTTTNGNKLVSNCRLEALETFTYQEGQMELTKGAIIAKRMVFNGNTVYLLNGSMLKASESIEANSNCTFTNNTTGNRSLIKTPKMNFTYGQVYNGNLTIEVTKHTEGKNQWDKPYQLTNGATRTTYDGSDVIIKTCDDDVNIPTGGTDPQNPGDIETKDKYIYTYAFEDQWPLYGDYDLNDLVVRVEDIITQKKKSSSLNYINNVSFTCKIMAVGATKNLSLALQLDGIKPSAVKSITFSNASGFSAPSELGLDNFSHTNYRENGQSKIVIPLAYNVHHLFTETLNQVNTSRNGIQKEVKSLNVKITFNNNAIKNFALKNNFNLFIITNGNLNKDRKEIHLAGYQPTDLASTMYFNNNNDKSIDNNLYYTSNDGLPWGFLIAQDKAIAKESTLWKWPLEYVPITSAYTLFEEWVKDSKTYKDWYKTVDRNKVF